jgi:hypothetical protein
MHAQDRKTVGGLLGGLPLVQALVVEAVLGAALVVVHLQPTLVPGARPWLIAKLIAWPLLCLGCEAQAWWRSKQQSQAHS